MVFNNKHIELYIYIDSERNKLLKGRGNTFLYFNF